MRSEYLASETPRFALEKSGVICRIQRKRLQRGGGQSRTHVLLELIVFCLQGQLFVGPLVIGGIVQQCVQAGDSGISTTNETEHVDGSGRRIAPHALKIWTWSGPAGACEASDENQRDPE